jgi:signal transduction histidine kinase/YHS domain-containing protein
MKPFPHIRRSWAVLGAALAGSLLVNGWGYLRIARPVRRLAAQAARLAQGEMTALEASCGGTRPVQAVQHTMLSMAGHVQRAQAEGAASRHALTDGQEAERARIAHELHDDTVQAFIAIAHSIDMAAAWLETDPEQAQAVLARARAQASDSVKAVRRLIADLRPPALEELGLVAALHMLADTAPDAPHETTRVEVTVHGQARRIGAAHELALFRIAQEAVRNAEQHGQAAHIGIEVAFSPGEICLLVRDDGRGFTIQGTPERVSEDAPQVTPAPAAAHEHFGLIGMHERAARLGGTVRVRSSPGRGTTIEAVLPLVPTDQPSEQVRDPVCGARIEPERAFGSTPYAGTRYYFCCPVCQGAFQREPAAYADR